MFIDVFYSGSGTGTFKILRIGTILLFLENQYNNSEPIPIKDRKLSTGIEESL